MTVPSDVAVAGGLEPSAWTERRNDGGSWRAGVWRPEEVARLLAGLRNEGAAALRAIDSETLLAGWSETLKALGVTGDYDQEIALPIGVAAPVAAGVGLSPQGLAAGLATLLNGLLRPAADRLAEICDRNGTIEYGENPGSPKRPRAVFLAGNLPGLAAQPLLRALLERRPVLLKSASNEPLFAPLLVRALRARLPALAPALAAISWTGGERSIEDVVLAQADLEAYGAGPAIADLARRAPGMLAHGPRASVAVVLGGTDVDTAAMDLAVDVALFDQRGCLSVQAIYVRGSAADAEAFASRLSDHLAALARRWPAGPARTDELAGVHQCRAEAELRGSPCWALAPAAGTVLLESVPRFLPSPGLRTVRVYPAPDEAAILSALSPWAGRLQGVAVAGTLAAASRIALDGLGVTRIAAAGTLQRADATWPNWGDRLEAGS